MTNVTINLLLQHKTKEYHSENTGRMSWTAMNQRGFREVCNMEGKHRGKKGARGKTDTSLPESRADVAMGRVGLGARVKKTVGGWNLKMRYDKEKETIRKKNPKGGGNK